MSVTYSGAAAAADSFYTFSCKRWSVVVVGPNVQWLEATKHGKGSEKKQQVFEIGKKKERKNERKTLILYL